MTVAMKCLTLNPLARWYGDGPVTVWRALFCCQEMLIMFQSIWRSTKCFEIIELCVRLWSSAGLSAWKRWPVTPYVELSGR